MAAPANDLRTAGALAKELGVPDTKVKKAILELGLQPDAKRGCCSYYGPEAVQKLKAVLG
jgi:hypothetical protein